MAGRTHQAAETARDALMLAQRNGEKGQEAWAQWLLGTIYQKLEPSKNSEAERCLRSALQIASSRQMAPLVAHCHFALATLSACREPGQATQRQFDDAFARFRALEMNRWLEMAVAEVGAEGLRTPMLIGLR
jgi:hypothetical protein